MKYHIFLDYRPADREFAVQLVRALEARGAAVWYNTGLEPSAADEAVALEALEESAMMAILFSGASSDSRQLRAGLAVADRQGKPVAPILIEPCLPRGACLIELADRNWIDAAPHPQTRLPELAELLTAVAGMDPPANDTSAHDAPADEPPRLAAAYVGLRDKKRAAGARRRDVLPVGWLDLLVLIPLAAATGFLAWSQPGTEILRLARAALAGVAVFGAYGAILFPLRYFMRGRTLARGVLAYLASSLILVGIGLAILGAVAVGVPDSRELFLAALRAGLAWTVISLIAFAIYGGAAAPVAAARFRANLRPL